MENFKKITKQQSPARTIAFGFAVLIFIGAALLSLPIAVRGAVQLPGLDALFTATSAVCVTGLVTVDPGDTFTLFGQAVLAVLMQLGGLGISSVSMGLAIAAGRRISFRGRSLGREAILAAAREAGLPCSQQEVRRILAGLDRAGLVRVSRGRGGTRLTPAGRALCRRQTVEGGAEMV